MRMGRRERRNYSLMASSAVPRSNYLGLRAKRLPPSWNT